MSVIFVRTCVLSFSKCGMRIPRSSKQGALLKLLPQNVGEGDGILEDLRALERGSRLDASPPLGQLGPPVQRLVHQAQHAEPGNVVS